MTQSQYESIFYLKSSVLLTLTKAIDINEAWREVLNMEEPINNTAEKIDAKPAADLYLLYTRNQVLGQNIKYGDVTSVTSSHFNANVSTVIVVHGWLEDRDSPINPTVRHALLKDSDVNVIFMDWSRYSKLGYLSATWGVPSVGRGLGQFIKFLNQTTGISYDSVHLVGFSLGGHVVGNAGRELDGKIARITALDPAGPLWYTNDDRLRPTDAKYVEAIHTNAGGLGIEMAVGHADFFPNGGTSQPGCYRTDILCDHTRAFYLFAASLSKRRFIGRQCPSTLAFIGNFCSGKTFPMGNNDLTKFGTGVYRLKTGAVYPF